MPAPRLLYRSEEGGRPPVEPAPLSALDVKGTGTMDTERTAQPAMTDLGTGPCPNCGRSLQVLSSVPALAGTPFEELISSLSEVLKAGGLFLVEARNN